MSSPSACSGTPALTRSRRVRRARRSAGKVLEEDGENTEGEDNEEAEEGEGVRRIGRTGLMIRGMTMEMMWRARMSGRLRTRRRAVRARARANVKVWKARRAPTMSPSRISPRALESIPADLDVLPHIGIKRTSEEGTVRSDFDFDSIDMFLDTDSRQRGRRCTLLFLSLALVVDRFGTSRKHVKYPYISKPGNKSKP